MHTRNISLSVLSLALLLALGACGGPRVLDPSPEELKATLEGQQIEFGPDREVIADAAIGAFEVVEIVYNHEESTSMAVVRFTYVADHGDYRVEGIISYQRSSLEKMRNPRFETNEANRM